MQDWSDAQYSGSSFGFAPQYSRHKVNYALSGMSLRHDYSVPYFLKCIDVGERSSTN